MIDKIYIPTLGRIGKQQTFDNLPSFVQDITVLVVQPQEQESHKGYPILVLPEDNIGLAKTRKWIYDYAGEERWGTLDDDLLFKKRVENWKFPQAPHEEGIIGEEDWKIILNGISEWFDNDFTFAGFRRGVLPELTNKKEYKDCTESICTVFFDGSKLPKSDDLIWNYGLLGEDIHLNLQLLLLGYKNRVWDKYVYVNKWAQPGGVGFVEPDGSTQRTIDSLNRSHKKLVGQYPHYITWRMNEDGSHVRLNSGSKYDGTKLIKVHWDKAYSDSQI